MSPHELLARQQKAGIIASAIWIHTDDEDRQDLALITSLAGADQEWRDRLAAAVGQRSPSEKTWALVLRLIRTRVTDHIRSDTIEDLTRTEPCPCGGTGYLPDPRPRPGHVAPTNHSVECHMCHRGRIGGWRNGLPVRCGERQRAAVDGWHVVMVDLGAALEGTPDASAA